ncbi:MAG: cobyric acid synthase [Myxococcota bacterium]
MLQGTASDVGKSLLVAGLGRVFARRGVSVAPFKSQNMALNAHVTRTGLEIGRAQALQARACGLEPEVDMNPILIKPQGDMVAQVVVQGRPAFRRTAAEYHDRKLALRGVVAESLERLRRRYDLVLIEGAGSPAEINLRDRDLVNMFVAKIADAPVLLVGDIDRGGVFAHLVGTLALLEPEDRARVAGLIINRFRGDISLLTPGITQLEELAGVPSIGVVRHVPDLRFAAEDSLSLPARLARGPAPADEIEVGIVRLPRASNLDEFDALTWEQGVSVRYVTHPAEAERADLLVIPGSKNTLGDLAWLRERGFDPVLRRRSERGDPILGICGGCQMLGTRIEDPDGVEAEGGASVEGLGLLPLVTRFEPGKRTLQVRVHSEDPQGPFGRFEGADGYWIHSGRTERLRGDATVYVTSSQNDEPRPDGALDRETGATVIGTMVHGLLDNEAPRRGLLRTVAKRCRRPWSPGPTVPDVDAELDRVADAVEEGLDMAAIDAILRERTP